ncbi:PKD domain-containing protein [Robiginitalea sp.]|uniref:PKD domain-containing protein n=1 Tax=Robiginitalea sp. TaxID=1902411 RepID=UPI003C439813
MKRLLQFLHGTFLRFAGLALLFLMFACSGDDDASQVIDCLQEAGLVQIDDDSAQGGMTVQFSIQYTGTLSVTEVNWDFGDGTKDSGNSVSHLYINSGTYQVQAQVSLSSGDNDCLAVSTTSVNIQ